MFVTLGYILFIGLPLLVFAYLVVVVLHAKYSVQGTPRKEMWVCPDHGPILRENLLEFSGVPYCPLCFHQRMNDAEKGALGKV